MINRTVCRAVFIFAAVCILFPLGIIFLWSITDHWRFPDLLPQSFGLRGMTAIFGKDVLPVLSSSIGISTAVALLSTVIGLMTARAVVFYEFKLKRAVKFLNLLPLIIPAMSFVFGVHLFFIKAGLSDTVAGVILIHLICGLPYSVNILCDLTASVGKGLEEQACLFGASEPRAFFEISFFALWPGMMTSFCMAYIISFSQYFITLIIGGGTVKTLSTVMVPLIQSGDRTLSGAYSIVFVFSTLIVFGAMQWISKKISLGREIEIYR